MAGDCRWRFAGRGPVEVAALRHHTDTVTMLAYSRGGALLLTTSHDGTAAVWRGPGGLGGAGAPLVVLPHEHWVQDGDWSPCAASCEVVTACASSAVRLWDARTATQLGVVRLAGSQATGANFCTQNEKLVGAVYQDGHVLLWDTREKEPEFLLRPAAAAAGAADGALTWGCCWTPCGTVLATASDILRTWDIRSPARCLREYREASASACLSIDCAPDGSAFAVTTQRNELVVVDRQSGRVRFASAAPGDWAEESAWCCAYSPDGALLAYTCENSLVVCSAATGRVVGTALDARAEHELCACTWAPGGASVLASAVGVVAWGTLVPAAWSPEDHARFPRAFRERVRAVLLCHRRPGCVVAMLSGHLLRSLFEWLALVEFS
eukprot:m51a1_g14360 hypothetical protein (381) ;mRNA; f:210807-212316